MTPLKGCDKPTNKVMMRKMNKMITTIKKCEITKQKMYNNKLVKLEDGKEISLDVYHMISLELRTGMFTLEQAQKIYKTLQENKTNLLHNLSNLCKIAEYKKIPSIEYVKEIVEKEDLLSIIKYSSLRKALGRKEHNNIMLEVFEKEKNKLQDVSFLNYRSKSISGNIKHLRGAYIKSLCFDVLVY